MKPSLIFYEVCPEKKSFLPTANTCSCALQLPRASNGVPLPDADKLFEFYHMAFANEYFGHTQCCSKRVFFSFLVNVGAF